MEEAKSEGDKIDPEDPLYGLSERLKHQKMDDNAKKIISGKLIEAQAKIKEKLE